MSPDVEIALSPQALRRNYRLGVANGAAFRLSLALVDASIVLPWFVSQITSSKIIIGLLLPIQNAGWFLPQLFMAPWVLRQRRRLPLYNAACAVRGLFWALMPLVAFVFGPGRPDVVLVGVLLGFAGYSFTGAVTGIAFTDLVGQGVEAGRRGTFFAWRNLTGGALALGGSLIVSRMIGPAAPLPFPHNFGVLAALNLLVITAMFVSLSFWREVDFPADDGASAGLSHAVWAILRSDRNLRGYLLTRILLTGAGATTPFFVVRAAELGTPQVLAGYFLAAYTASELVSSLGWGRLADRFSYKLVIGLLAGLAMLQNLLVLAFRPTWPPALYLGVFALLGIIQGGWMVSSLTSLLEIAPPERRALYTGLANTVLGLATLLLPMGGVLAQFCGLQPLMAVAATLAAGGLASLATWHDPRRAGRATARGVPDLSAS